MLLRSVSSVGAWPSVATRGPENEPIRGDDAPCFRPETMKHERMAMGREPKMAISGLE
jgi:hypothetical protein